MMAISSNKGALVLPQATALKHVSGKPSQKRLAMPCAPRSPSCLKGLPLSRRVVPKSQQRRNLNIVATATSLSRQLTSVPGFSQIGEPVPEGLLLSEVVKSLPKEDLRASQRIVQLLKFLKTMI